MAAGMDEIGMIEQEAGNVGAEGIGVAQFITGLKNEKKDDAALASLNRPFYKIQDEYIQNRNIGEGIAGQGMPSAQRNYLTQQSERGLGSSLDAILRGGGGVNDASLLLHQYNDQIGKIGAEDASQHLSNIQYFQKANADLAGQKNIQWSVNELQPYEAKLAELKKNRAIDEQNKWGGLTSAVGSMIGAGTANQNSALMKKMFDKNNKGDDPFTKMDIPPSSFPAQSIGDNTSEGSPSGTIY